MKPASSFGTGGEGKLEVFRPYPELGNGFDSAPVDEIGSSGGGGGGSAPGFKGIGANGVSGNGGGICGPRSVVQCGGIVKTPGNIGAGATKLGGRGGSGMRVG